LKRKSKGEKKQGVNEELRYMGWTEREEEKETHGERKRSYDLRDAKRENAGRKGR